ncbi:MAG: cyclic nucleotide-binding domain-containing protein [Opitutaceae bacterium]|jgi:CRP-like cAMP-binding protein
MDQNLLLTAEKLTLNPDVQRGWVSRGAFVIKNVTAQAYLTVSNEQALVLDAFAEGRTVPDVFARMLRDRFCLPLREFYELVVKAHQAGILCSTRSRKQPRRAIRWPSVRAFFLLWPSAFLAAVTLVWLACRTPLIVMAWEPLVMGFGVAMVALSMGQMLAGAMLAGAGGEVYPCPFLVSLGWLHLRLDLSDTRLLRPQEQALVVLVSNLPLSLALLAVSFRFPSEALSLAGVWLLAWRPWGAGLPRRLAALFSRYPYLDTDSQFLFLPNQRPQLHWRDWWRRWDWRVCAVELGWAAGWSLLVARITLDGLGLSFMDVFTDWGYWSTTLPIIGSALLITIMVIMVRRWRDGGRQVWRRMRQRWATGRRRWRRDYVFPDNEAALLRVATAHPLLGLLNPYDQAAIIRAWRPVTLKAWTVLAGPEEESHHVGLILSGRAIASRIGKSGKRVRALLLEEGDFFGLPHLSSGGDAVLEVKSRSPVSAMMVPMRVFQEMVIRKLGAQVVYDLTHKYAFLQRLPVCAHWHAHAVARFARLAQIGNYGDGEYIVHAKDETNWFYILYDGVAQVRSDSSLISRLKSGNFFGEISLLQNSVAIADVVAQGQVRCLQIDRTSFLRFMTHNHHVALQLEKISSRRLGYPIFPLETVRFDVRGRYDTEPRKGFGRNSWLRESEGPV